jgi:membrane protease YdiL (CAAX protease family)
VVERALLLTLAVWSLLLAASLLVEQGASRPIALSAAFLVGTLLAAAARPRRPRHRRGAWLVLLALGLLAGFASYPLWVDGVTALGRTLGWTLPRPVPPGIASPLLALATLALAPCMEELVYRERLLPALARSIGPLPAVLASSAAFALPHLEPWTVLATFAVGVFLGAVMLASGAVSLCIGIHAGLNLAAATCGLPPEAWALPPLVGGALGAALVAGGIAWAPARRGRTPPDGSRRLRREAGAGMRPPLATRLRNLRTPRAGSDAPE